MPDEMIDKKITQGQADRLAAPLELDLWSAFRVMEEDMVKLAEGYEGTPEEFIDEVTSLLLPGGGENNRVNKEFDMGICRTVRKNKLAANIINTWAVITKAKALPPGTRRKRRGGTYEKQGDGTWKKVTDKKDDKKQEKQRGCELL